MAPTISIQVHLILWAGLMTSRSGLLHRLNFIFAGGQKNDGGCYIGEVECSATQLDGPRGCIGNFAVAR